MKNIALIAALTVGAASLLLFEQYKRDFEEKVSGGERIAVLVAATEIELGSIVGESSLAVREIPESYLDTRHIRAADVAKTLGIRATMRVRPNEALLWTDLAVSNDEHRVLSGLVQSGMRAITVSIARGASMGGLLRPGDRVDLLLQAVRDDKRVVLPILQNVLVLAVGSKITSNTEKNILELMQSGSGITFSVTSQQAQVLTLAQAEGTLSAALRNPDDIVVQLETPITTTESIHLAEKRAALQLRSPRSAPKPPKKPEIEHVR